MNNHDKLKRALEQDFNEKHKYDPQEEDRLDWDFTEEYDFEKKLDKLMHSQKKPYWKYMNTPIRKVAVAVIIFLMIFSTFITVPAVRRTIVDFIVRQYDEFSSYFVNEESLQYSDEQLPEKIEEIYMPFAIPDGYRQIDYYADDYGLFAFWRDSNNNQIEFYQEVVVSNNNLNTENTTMKEITLNGISIYTYTLSELTTYTWYDNGYIFIMNVPESFSLEQVSEMINSVKIID